VADDRQRAASPADTIDSPTPTTAPSCRPENIRAAPVFRRAAPANRQPKSVIPASGTAPPRRDRTHATGQHAEYSDEGEDLRPIDAKSADSYICPLSASRNELPLSASISVIGAGSIAYHAMPLSTSQSSAGGTKTRCLLADNDRVLARAASTGTVKAHARSEEEPLSA